jgi:hypothetical protein
MDKPIPSPVIPEGTQQDLHDISTTLKMMLALMLADSKRDYMFGPCLRSLYADDNENTGTTTGYAQVQAGIDGR